MSLVDGWLNQTMLYKRYTDTSDTGKLLYDPPVEIACRLQDDRQLIRDESGREVVSEAVLFTAVEVGPQDVFVLRGRDLKVIRAARKVNLDGEYDHTEVRL